MEIIDSRVLSDTMPTESSVFFENFEENIVVIAAVGALDEIIIDLSTISGTPNKYIQRTTAAGIMKMRRITARMPLMFLSAFKILLFAR